MVIKGFCSSKNLNKNPVHENRSAQLLYCLFRGSFWPGEVGSLCFGGKGSLCSGRGGHFELVSRGQFGVVYPDYLNDKLNSDLQFQYENTYGVCTMFLHNLIPNETIFTIVTTDETIEASKNYKSEGYNMELVYKHLGNFLTDLAN